ncbi:MAG: hypothetical protein GF388_12170 [Candidatus Aegiribacteria sp.]|nr:hypothetical protein [Candidatus Aegiribacteria sp.]
MMRKIVTGLFLGVFVFSGCGGGSDTPASNVDTSDPLQVAKAFYEAVDQGDVDAALEYVDPEMASDFRSAMSGGLPSLPSDYEVMVLTEGDEAEANVTGANLDIDLVLIDGEWWVTR